MPYNTDLEQRIDLLTPKLYNLTKRKMFGGLGYLLNGNMCFGIHKELLLLRVSNKLGEELLKDKNYRPFDMTRHPMPGWILVASAAVKTDQQLLDKLRLGLEYAESLPKK